MATGKSAPELLRDLVMGDGALSEVVVEPLRLALSVEDTMDRERATKLLNDWPELVADWRQLEEIARTVAETVTRARTRVEAALEEGG